VFVNELVPAEYVRNAIGLNAAVFQTTRLVGPGVAGLLISTVGSGWAFAANSVCFLLPDPGAAADPRLRADRGASGSPRAGPAQGHPALRRARPHLAWDDRPGRHCGHVRPQLPIVLTGMARDQFHGGASLYGLFNIMLAVGSVSGALTAGARTQVRCAS